MENSKRRQWITSKDIEVLAECSARHARRLLEKLRRKLKKASFQPISIAEFCQYLGIDIENAYRKLGL